MKYQFIDTNDTSEKINSELVSAPVKKKSLIKILFSTLLLWRHNYASRRQLAQLSQGQLKDIGINRSEALEEARKPFWKP